MQKLCPKCHHIGKGQYFIFPASLLWGSFFIGIGIMNINTDLFGSRILSLILSIILIPSGLFDLLSYFFGGKRCPNCGNASMILLNSREAQQIINDGKFENKHMICSSCCNINKFVQTKKQNKYGSLALFSFGLLGIISLLLNEINSSVEVFEWLGYLVFLSVGIYGLYTNFIFTKNCPQCSNKNTMIPLDSPKAQALIKEHNLTILEDALQPSSPKTSQ